MKGFVRAVVWIAGILGAIGLLLHLFVFDVWTVPPSDNGQFAASILPTMQIGDHVLVQRGRIPNVGELARCASPLTSGTLVVGRVFGRGGDRVEVSDGRVMTNGTAVASRHGCPQMIVPHPITQNLITMNCGVAETGAWSFSFLTASEGLSGGTSAALVEPGKMYLVSDNRLMHEDSRDFGQVDEATCEHVVYRLWGERFTDSTRRFTILW